MNIGEYCPKQYYYMYIVINILCLNHFLYKYCAFYYIQVEYWTTIHIWTSAIYILSVFFFEEHNWLFFFFSAIFASKIWLVYSKNLDTLYFMFYLTLITIFIYQTTNDAINLRKISERISTFPNMTILSVQIQGYFARLFSIEINRKIFITI